MENFIVHPTGKGGQRTDADLIGVRFPHRAERLIDDPDNIMRDDCGTLGLSKNLTDIVIVEVKTNGPCTLNGPWTNEDAENVQRVLAAIGCFEPGRLEEVAKSVYQSGVFEDAKLKLRVRLVAIGAVESDKLRQDFPRVVQVMWPEVLGFIGYRLYTFRTAKKAHHQWDDQIKLMMELMNDHSHHQTFREADFISDCLNRLGVKYH